MLINLLEIAGVLLMTQLRMYSLWLRQMFALNHAVAIRLNSVVELVDYRCSIFFIQVYAIFLQF